MTCGLQKSCNRASKKSCVGPSSFLLDNSARVLPLLIWMTTWCQTVPSWPSDVQTSPLASGLGTKSPGGYHIARRSSGSSALRCSFQKQEVKTAEGYLDTPGLWTAGGTREVCSCGSNLTVDQIKYNMKLHMYIQCNGLKREIFHGQGKRGCERLFLPQWTHFPAVCRCGWRNSYQKITG